MDVGAKLLRAYCSNGEVYDFVKSKITEELFYTQDEKDLFNFVNDHVTKYHKLPAEIVVTDAFPDLPQVTEPIKYYLDKVIDRFNHKSLVKTLSDVSVMLENKQVDESMGLINDTMNKLTRTALRTKIVDFKEDALEIIQQEYLKAKGHQTGILFGWDYLDSMTQGLFAGDVASYVGRPACLSGDTKIWVSRKKGSSGREYSLKQLYERFNGGEIPCCKSIVRKWDKKIPTKINSLKEAGFVGLNTVNDVVYSGVKKTYTITTNSGKSLRATLEHKFKTSNGFIALSDLKIGDIVLCRSTRKYKEPIYEKRNVKEVCGKYPYSPYRTRIISGHTYQRVAMPRLVYDAGTNGIHPDDFLQQLKSNPTHNLIFSDTTKHIHHIDGDWTNNSFDNLECLSEADHQKLHNDKDHYVRRFNRYEVQEETITAIDYYGEEDTYDICMNYPDNNFVAQDFVVHNSGKTYMILKTAEHAWKIQKKNVLVVSMEMAVPPLVQRITALTAKVSATELKKGILPNKKPTDMWAYTQNVLLKQQDMDNSLWILDGNLSSTPEQIYTLASYFQPDIVFIDGAYLLKSTNRRLDRYTRVAENIEYIKSATSELAIPTTLSYQFNRDASKKKNDEEVGLEDIAFSDAIGQISSVVLGMFQKESVETLIKKRINVLKGREGAVGGFEINWNFNTMDFSEIKNQSETLDTDKEKNQLGYI